MASLITTLPSVAFPHEVDALDISSTAATTVELRYADTVIFKSTLYPIDGTIALRDVASLLDNYMGATVQAFTVWIDGSNQGETSIIPCRMQLDCTAEEWNGGSFLTRTTNKYTHEGATELISFWGTNPTLIITLTLYNREKGSLQTVKDVRNFTGSFIKNFPLSERVRYLLKGNHTAFDIVQYSVEVGQAKITYRMIPDGMADTLHEFGFINSFMQEEYITLTGEAERELKVERLHAYVGGQYRNFQVDAVPHWTIHSGVLLDGMQGLFDDFISSKKIWRKSDNVMMAVTSSDYKAKDSSTALNGGTVTLRETGRRYRHRLQRPVKTFDETFDDTFK